MKKVYQNFAEILADYPETYGARVYHHLVFDNDGRGTIVESFLEMKICMSEEVFLQTAPYTFKHWQLIPITPNESWFTALENYAPLQGLKIVLSSKSAPETSQFYAQRQASFYALTRLKHLELQQASKDLVAYIPNLPTLRTVEVVNCHNPLFESPLSLEAFAIRYSYQVDIDDLARQLNPETLEHLTVMSTKHIKSTNKEAVFPRLKFVEMSYNFEGLRQFPCALEGCRALETLILKHNRLATLPASMSGLTALKKLDLEGNPLRTKKIIAQETDIIALIQQDTAPDIKQKLWAILLEDTKVTKKYTLFELLTLLIHTTQKNLLKKIHTLLESKFKQNPLEGLPAFTRVALVGKLPAMAVAEVKNALKPHNITLEARMSAQTEVVCVGEGATPEAIGELLAMPKKPVICLPTHFKTFLQTLEKPYLADTAEDMAEHLGNLLINNDKANVVLALQMIKTGGLPAGFLEFLYLLWFEGGDCQEEIEEVLRRYSTFAQFEAIHKYIIKTDFRGLDELFKSKYFNQVDLVKMALRYFLPRLKQDTNNSLLWHLGKKLWSLKGVLIEQVVEHHLQTDGTLLLGLYQFSFKIPTVLIGNDRVKKLVVQRDFNLYQPRTLQKLIESLPALTDLVVLVPFLEDFTQEENTIFQQQEKESYERKYPALHIYIVEDR